MASLDDAQRRAQLIAGRLRERTDLRLRAMILDAPVPLDYEPLEQLMISETAWHRVAAAEIAPRLVFAHPDLLRSTPRVSEYYRGVALLSRKRVAELAGPVESWEDDSRTPRITQQKSLAVARLYNAVTSSIIDGATDWTLENGYRNIIANMGIGLDGTMRNVIGQDAELTIKSRIGRWLEDQKLIGQYRSDTTQYDLPNNYSMRFGSEPDIEFRRSHAETEQVAATIEIKGGKDPAGALERLGAIQKSFEETPPGSVNILIAGVITQEMSERLDNLGITHRFLLDDLTHDGQPWTSFLNELFHHIVRIAPTPITSVAEHGAPSEGTPS